MERQWTLTMLSKGKGKKNHQNGQQQHGGNRLPPQEIKALRTLGLCFKCKQPGHTAKQCMFNAMPYPAQPVNPFGQPQYGHKVNRNMLGINNMSTMTDSHQGNGSNQ